MSDLVLLNLLLTACVVISAGAVALAVWAVLDARKARRMGEEGIRAMREALALLRDAKGAPLTPAVQRLERLDVEKAVAVPKKKAATGKPRMFRGATEDEKWASWAMRHPEGIDPDDMAEAKRIFENFQATREVA